MATQIYLIVDSVNSAVIQSGAPPTNVSAYLLDVPDGATAQQVAEDFFLAQKFPLNSAVFTVDIAYVQPYAVRAVLAPLSDVSVAAESGEATTAGGDVTPGETIQVVEPPWSAAEGGDASVE
jgi:hypothetical protein